MFSFQIASCTHTKYKPSLRKEAVVSSIRYNNIIHSSSPKKLIYSVDGGWSDWEDYGECSQDCVFENRDAESSAETAIPFKRRIK